MISLELSLDGQPGSIELSQEQFETVYQPVMEQIVAVQQRLQRRILVGIAGPPGCGKTYFSKLLTMLLNQNTQQEMAVYIGMDGWHYSQKQLEQMTFCRDGKLMLLKAIKGAPESFDVDDFLDFLKLVRDTEKLSFPMYDRTIHDPVQHLGQIDSGHQIILIEGNYLLLNEVPWNEIKTFLDLSCFLWADEKLRWHTLLKRHLKGGKNTSQALRHTRYVDMANARRIGHPQADIQINRISEKELALIKPINL